MVALTAPGGNDVADPLELTARAEDRHFWFRGFRRFVAPVLHDVAAGRRDLRLVDCGCGTGTNLSLLEPFGRVVGLDLADRLGCLTTRRSRPLLLRADITRLPFPADTFDIATSFDVLQSLDRDEAAVAEMARVVRPGGAVVLTMAALEALRGDHSEAWRERRRYTPAMARRLVAGAGLRLDRTAFLFASTFPLLLVRRMAQRRARLHRGPRPEADIAVPAAPVNALLTWLVSVEAAVARHLAMPVGSSLLVVAYKEEGGRRKEEGVRS